MQACKKLTIEIERTKHSGINKQVSVCQLKCKQTLNFVISFVWNTPFLCINILIKELS